MVFESFLQRFNCVLQAAKGFDNFCWNCCLLANSSVDWPSRYVICDFILVRNRVNWITLWFPNWSRLERVNWTWRHWVSFFFSVLSNCLGKLEWSWLVVVSFIKSQGSCVRLQVVEFAVHDVFVTLILCFGIPDVIAARLRSCWARLRVVSIENRWSRVRDSQVGLIWILFMRSCHEFVDGCGQGLWRFLNPFSTCASLMSLVQPNLIVHRTTSASLSQAFPHVVTTRHSLQKWCFIRHLLMHFALFRNLHIHLTQRCLRSA